LNKNEEVQERRSQSGDLRRCPRLSDLSYATEMRTRIFALGFAAGWFLLFLPPAAAQSRLANLSTRCNVDDGSGLQDNLIAGFIISGSEPKRVMVRAIGPSLASSGVAGAILNPSLDLYNSEETEIATNDNWQKTIVGGVITSGQARQIKKSGLAPTEPAESAIIATLPAGAYTAIMRHHGGTTGVGLIELYDLDASPDSRLVNISTLGMVETDPNVMIAGTIVTGNVLARVLIRALGPSLADHAGLFRSYMQDPTLEVYNGDGALLRANDNWRQNQQAEIDATGLAPTRDREAAIVARLAPGAYTAIVRGKDSTVGVALVEEYQLPE
jgi:hypothetical protein